MTRKEIAKLPLNKLIPLVEKLIAEKEILETELRAERKKAQQVIAAMESLLVRSKNR